MTRKVAGGFPGVDAGGAEFQVHFDRPALRHDRSTRRCTMTNAKVIGLRSVELGVPDLNRSSDFYQKVWGLEEVISEGDAIHLRGTGSEHHVVTLRQRSKPALIAVHFAAS